ncbi:MAG: TonB family protein, partial [Muribaculaceae bacterium]|nr:TonB family protein [Muribaculaceae bacterium]
VDIVDGVDDATKTVVKKEVEIVEDKPKVEETYDLANVQQKPEFPGGDKAMYEFMNKNIHYPPAAQEDGIEGTVVVQFTIGKDGQVTGAKAVRSPHESLSNEAVRMVMSMPKWTPGRNNGQAVKVNYTLPVRFKLSK